MCVRLRIAALISLCFITFACGDSVALFQMELVNDLRFGNAQVPGKLNGFKGSQFVLNRPHGWLLQLAEEVVVTHVAWNDFEQDGLVDDAFITVTPPGSPEPVIGQVVPQGQNAELTPDGWRLVEVEPTAIGPGNYYVFSESLDETVTLFPSAENNELIPIVRDPRLASWSFACGSHFEDLPGVACVLGPSMEIGPMLFVEPPEPSLPGDYNNDGILDIADLDAWDLSWKTSGFEPPKFDANGDNRVNVVDREFWVVELKNTYFGDANLDGEFNSSDLVAVFQSNKYEDGIAFNSSWSDGDWDLNFEFDSSDLVLAFQQGGYEAGPRFATHAVPEPSTLASILLPILILTRVAATK